MTDTKYYPPAFNEKQFHCPNCDVYASQYWRDLYINTYTEDNRIKCCICSHCNKKSYWFDERMIFPANTPVEPPNNDIPDNCKKIYVEAAQVMSISPRAAVALLRLCVQELMPYIGGTGKNINTDIKNLFANGLDEKVQKALDTCRVIGNEAVHPGQINVNDNPEYAISLFSLINFIVNERITLPNQRKAMFDSLPTNKKDEIKKRDKKDND